MASTYYQDAGYYKMQEVMDKLRKTEEEVQELVKQGKLRQYMDAGKPVFKVNEVNTLAEEIVGLDMNTGGSEIDIMLDETGEIQLEPDEPPKKDKDSEGGFGLSQQGDLTMADTNVGTVGINILSGTEDAYKLTEDTKAETQAGDLDEIEALDADANLEAVGSGSGLLDLSLQADDTSLGAVLDDILPSADEMGAGGIAPEPLADEAGLIGTGSAIKPGGVAEQEPQVAAAAAPQMMIVAQEDPASTLYGIMMFLPIAAIILASIALTAAINDVNPSMMKSLTTTTIAEISLIWYIVGGLAIVVLLFLAFSAMSGSKKEKPAKEVYVKTPKKKKK